MMTRTLMMVLLTAVAEPARAGDSGVDRLIDCIESVSAHSSGAGALVTGPGTDVGERRSYVLPGTRLGRKGFYVYVGRLLYRNTFGDLKEVPGGVYFFDGRARGDLALTFPDEGKLYADSGFTRPSDRTFFRENGLWNAYPRLTRPSRYLPRQPRGCGGIRHNPGLGITCKASQDCRACRRRLLRRA